MLKFTLIFWVAYALWCLGAENPPKPGAFIALYLLVMVPWGLGWLIVRAVKPKIVEVKIPVYVPVPAPPPVPSTPPNAGGLPSPEEIAAAAKAKYEATLRTLQAAGLDETELYSARAAAKQRYLRDLDGMMK